MRANLEGNGTVALGFCPPTIAKAVQLKGVAVVLGEPGPEDLGRVERHVGSFRAECGRIGGVLDRVTVQPSVARAAWVLGQEDPVHRSIMLVAALEWARTTPESGQRATGIQWLTRLKASLDAPESARQTRNGPAS